jgi:septum formation protein
MHSYKIILASKSPRRQQLLREAGYTFEVQSLGMDETFPDTLPTQQVATYLAKEKNMAHRDVFQEGIIITADTVVVFNDHFLGKPNSAEEAIITITRLSGQKHEVISGVCISNPDKQLAFDDVTEVKFKTLTKREIEHYVNNFKPFDKAGSYEIQEWIGLIGIEWIRGSYFNVVGLPIHKVYKCLSEDFGILPFS